MKAQAAALAGAAALVAAFVPLPRSGVERFYSDGVYRILQPALTGFSNRFPFALLDLLLVGVTAGWLFGAARDAARVPTTGLGRAAGRIAMRSVVLASALYVGFLAMWGLNYRRVALADRLGFDAAAVGPHGALILAGRAAERLDALYEEAHRAGWKDAGVVDPALSTAFEHTQRTLGASRLARPGRPKRSLLDLYFRRASVDGMTDPYFLETLVVSNLLPFERPFVDAHEWAHLAGLADEGDANFAAWLTCVAGPAPIQYSGWLFLYTETVAGLDAAGRLEAAGRLDRGPRDDLRAIAGRIARDVSPRVSRAGWRVYDRYLKANRIEAGAASYATVVKLVLGTPLGRETATAHGGPF